MTRTFQRPIKRVVVKLGSSQIADGNMRPKTRDLLSLALQIGDLRSKGIEVVLVSSGAIALGMGELGESKRSTDLAQLQARAAIGQAALMRLYSDLLDKVGLKCAQVLLTWDDFDDHSRFLNARHTLEAILKQGVVPIINENDTTSTEEIKFGDNDKLSALVASFLHADLLVILSDVEGVYDGNKKVYQEIKEITAEIDEVAGGTKNAHMARGGMKAKIEAVKIATQARIPCIITAGNIKDVLVELVAGKKIGTYFIEKNAQILDGDSEHEFIRKHFGNSKKS
ncbi:MAG: glutamate 5-kinase [Candidatus Omnitrophica bacterium]|nr:glutamate 5-kinase [Candidatus Omnitrophota bacterium]MDE2008544.1 glutamate 5-kinase [Candidatus Omnitrophota bacterium]